MQPNLVVADAPTGGGRASIRLETVAHTDWQIFRLPAFSQSASLADFDLMDALDDRTGGRYPLARRLVEARGWYPLRYVVRQMQ